jgi:hypothetical protein
MTDTIVVPPGEEGDRILVRLLPQLYAMAQAEHERNR